MFPAQLHFHIKNGALVVKDLSLHTCICEEWVTQAKSWLIRNTYQLRRPVSCLPRSIWTPLRRLDLKSIRICSTPLSLLQL